MTDLADRFAQALAAHQAGRLAEAERGYREILARDPRHSEVIRLLGLIALAVGNATAAIALIGESVKLNPDVPDAQAQLGMALRAAGRLEEAVAHLERASRLAPDDATVLGNLTGLLRAVGQPERGRQAGRRAVVLAPALAEAWLNLGNLDHGQALGRALAIRPAFYEALVNLGNARNGAGDLPGAARAYQAALAQRGDSIEALTNLGIVLLDLDKVEAARLCHRRVVALTPGEDGALGNLGAVAKAGGRIGDAVAWQGRALAVRVSAGTLNSLGVALQAMGDMERALLVHRRAIAGTVPPAWHSNLLFCLCYSGKTTSEDLFLEVEAWAKRHVPQGRPKPPRRVGPARLKVGILSSDLSDHAVGRNVLGLFEQRREIDLRAYAEVARGDAMTARFRSLADGWVTTVGMSDEAVAERVRRDGIDVLVVVAGHTAKNRPLVAAWGAAPVQASFGDLTTTGIRAVDWWLTDAVLHPEGTRERFTEGLWRLPCFYLHPPPEGAPEVGPAPSETGAPITFISCNNPAKLTPDVIALWARVLAAVPGSRLMLKYLGWFGDSAIATRFERLFAVHGIGKDRLDLRGGTLRRTDQLAFLRQADIALDPFPFNGATTSFEALWMGLPVVTLAGERFLGRMGASMLTALKMEELIAVDAEGYVARAVALADDRRRLAALRRSLRVRVLASPLCDATGYAKAFEGAMRGMAGG
jgi:protein O-GlcNAc transferase